MNIKTLYKGINDKIYGLCLPKVIVNYDREYYLLEVLDYYRSKY